jgi:hypothetical protein
MCGEIIEPGLLLLGLVGADQRFDLVDNRADFASQQTFLSAFIRESLPEKQLW